MENCYEVPILNLKTQKLTIIRITECQVSFCLKKNTSCQRTAQGRVNARISWHMRFTAIFTMMKHMYHLISHSCHSDIFTLLHDKSRALSIKKFHSYIEHNMFFLSIFPFVAFCG